MTGNESNRFSAAGPMLGYLAQVEYALLIALQRMEGEVSLRFSLETVDDITFDVAGSARELWQTKHSVTRGGSLGDSSPDLWKSLHNWIETSDESSECFLFTTATAPADSVAVRLRPERSQNDLEIAREGLDRVANARGNVANGAYYDRYTKLTPVEKLALLSRVTVLDGMIDAAALTDSLVASVRKSTTASRRLPLVERLRGWWQARAIQHLTQVARGESDWIQLEEIENRLLQIAQTLRDDNLPLDYDDVAEPGSHEVLEDDRVFVEQLKLIALSNERIRQAIYDHNRAFLQRSRWQREQLLDIGELDRYDRRLVEEWRRAFDPIAQSASSATSEKEEKQQQSQELYVGFQQRVLPEIRTEVRSGYIPYGSLHMLADRLQIGWHPDWVELLRHRLGDVEGNPEIEGAA